MGKVTDLFKKATGKEKLSNKEKPDEFVGDISMDKVKEMAKSMDLPGNSEEAKIRQVIGSCISFRIKVDGKDPREYKNYPN